MRCPYDREVFSVGEPIRRACRHNKQMAVEASPLRVVVARQGGNGLRLAACGRSLARDLAAPRARLTGIFKASLALERARRSGPD